jgi:hypothetical protein
LYDLILHYIIRFHTTCFLICCVLLLVEKAVQKEASMTSKVSTAPNSRPVHPCYLSVWEGNTGAEYATWANMTNGKLPDLVTAQASSLNIYSIEESSGKLLLVHSFPNLEGSVCYLDTLRVEDEPDSLLIGFSGHPRMAVVSVQVAEASSLSASPKILLATSLLDLTPALVENSYGSVTPLEQDLMAFSLQKKNVVTVSVILGGGVAVPCITLRHTNGGWLASEPYLLPLKTFSISPKFLDKSKAAATAPTTAVASTGKDLIQSIVTGFGDILGAAFLPGYLEPTLILLHANPLHGHTFSARLGRPNGAGGTRYGLIVTAISVTATHQRSAVLWSAEVPADALSLHSVGDQGCLVQCANSIVSIDISGQIRQCLAVNGWVKSSLSSRLLELVQPNPWPFPKLAIQLDGAKMAVVNDKSAFLTLRCGQVYLLQYSNSWCLLPLHQTIGAVGQVANLLCWPFGGEEPKAIFKTLLDKEVKPEINMGLVFVGSRLGDSSLLGYALESTSVADALEQHESLRQAKLEADNAGVKQEQGDQDDYDTILRLEEDALYAHTTGDDPTFPDLIPPSDEESDQLGETGTSSKRKRARLSQLLVVRSLTALDSITALGPLGNGCEGPLAKSPYASSADSRTPAPLGASAYIFPCGYGSSGGLALLTAPGRDDRALVAEEDCINVQSIFSLPGRGLVVLSMEPAHGGARFLKLEDTDKGGVKTEDGTETVDNTLDEVDLDSWCSPKEENNPRHLFSSSTILSVIEMDEENVVMVVSSQIDEVDTYSLVELTDGNGRLAIKNESQLSVPDGTVILTITPFIRQGPGAIAFAYTLASGNAKVVIVDGSGSLRSYGINASFTEAMEEEDQSEEEIYYKNDAIVAVDVFVAPKKIFLSTTTNERTAAGDANRSEVLPNGTTGDGGDCLLDEDDIELYGEPRGSPSYNNVQSNSSDNLVDSEEVLFLGVCRQSGLLEIYVVSDFASNEEASPVWSSQGCGHGVSEFESLQDSERTYRTPRMHKVYTREMRFFFCGPSSPEWCQSLTGPRMFCLVIETSEGDTLLYSADVKRRAETLTSFNRVPLKLVTRPSQEQSRHFAKLRRKGIVGKEVESQTAFRHNRLYPFRRISGQDGLFAAVARPIWFIAERGKPTVLCHRSRHVAPAGAKPRPVSGFCSGLLVRIVVCMLVCAQLEPSVSTCFLTLNKIE